MDARTAEVVTSVEVDFESRKWTVEPTRLGYNVGAGNYVMIPCGSPEHGWAIAAEVKAWQDRLSSTAAGGPNG